MHRHHSLLNWSLDWCDSRIDLFGGLKFFSQGLAGTMSNDNHLLFPGAPTVLVNDDDFYKPSPEDIEKGLTLLRIMRAGIKEHQWNSAECAFQSDSFFLEGPNLLGDMIETTNEWHVWTEADDV